MYINAIITTILFIFDFVLMWFLIKSEYQNHKILRENIDLINEIIRLNNLNYLQNILDENESVIECGSFTDPKDEVFNQPIKPKL